ncbi:metallophosphoesterase [Alteromonadaceae bacterium BrNp21-10]|nr:metallophosphoesterase [Alteromonadaceae bacterium BrNp21-10]
MKVIIATYCRLLVLSVLLLGSAVAAEKPVRIAFLPDIHFHDVYATFADNAFSGIEGANGTPRATIRSMSAQLHSTRLFNENYFALIAALDDLVAKGITLVALPGDFSDDGQPIHLRGLARILDKYRKQHGMQFFAINGNHDPVRPFDSPGGESNFLKADGSEQAIFSKGTQSCPVEKANMQDTARIGEHSVICSEDIRHLGYAQITHIMADFGFFPNAQYQYWATPFSDYNTDNYNFNKALTQSALAQRQYEICREGSGGEYKKNNDTLCSDMTDTSYVVEPVPGLWLLAIDANVYLPTAMNEQGELRYDGSGNAGYNKVISHKKHLIKWIKTVVEQAQQQHKKLISFSHFPMAEFYDGQSDSVRRVFGNDAFQLAREPQDSVSELLANTGLQIHVGGHMHMNDSRVIHSSSGKTLVNIQGPSLAAYIPAYKMLSFSSDTQLKVQTILLENVPRFNELFDFYQREYQMLSEDKIAISERWDKSILSSKNYRDFALQHIRGLTLQRFLPSEWPNNLRSAVFALSAQQLLLLSQMQTTTLPANEQDWQHLFLSADADVAKQKVKHELTAQGIEDNVFTQWTALDLAVDLYRLRNAGVLAITDIGDERLQQYRLLQTLYQRFSVRQCNDRTLCQLQQQLSQVLQLIAGFQMGQPDGDFEVDLLKGKIY